MLRCFRAAVLALMLVPSAGTAQDFDGGLAAAQVFATALSEWRSRAEQGDAEAQTILGAIYDQGQGVPQDDAEAVKWYRLAAEQGNATAQLALGVMYFLGRGLPRDFGWAYMWLTLAAANGQTKSAKYRDLVAQVLSLADLSEAQRRARVCLASAYQDCD